MVNISRPTEEVGSAFTDMLLLYYDLAKNNQGCNMGHASQVLQATQQLLLNYYDACIQYLADESQNRSLLHYIAGDDGIEQFNVHKSFLQTYKVYVY